MDEFVINDRVFDTKISMDEVTRLLDKKCDETDTEEDNELLLTYCLQLMRHSGIETTTNEELFAKLKQLMLTRIMYRLEEMGLVETHLDENAEVSASVTILGHCVHHELTERQLTKEQTESLEAASQSQPVKVKTRELPSRNKEKNNELY